MRTSTTLLKANRRPTSHKGRIRWWSVLFWLVVWQVGAMAMNQQILLVSPLQVLARLAQLVFELSFWKAAAYSTLRITGGFLIGMVTAIVLAMAAARFRWIADLCAPLMLVIQTVPVASFIILALIFFSSKNLAVFISFLMVLPIFYNGILGGIWAVDRQLKEMAQVFKLPLARRIRYIDLPQVLPYFQTTCASALGLCWKSGIAAEVIGMPAGSIGAKLQQAKVYLDTPDLFAWTLVIVLISLAFEKLFMWLLQKLTQRLEQMPA